ncbi:integrase/recombinase xerD homolog isoform X2 [Dreissena polymorpha]|nr:integrase/recombinase xerD homolog isoform X2 [Dreissena polymorpha]
MKRTRQRKKTATSTTCLCCKGTTSSGKQPKNSTPAGPSMEPAADQPRDVPIPAVPDSLTYAPAATGSSTPYPSQVQSDFLFPTATTNRQLPLPLDPNVGLHTVPLDPNVGLHTAMPSFDIDSSSSSDEDQGFSFSQALHTHARDILPDLRIQGNGSPHGPAANTHPRAPFHILNQTVYKLLDKSLAPSTKASYKNAFLQYQRFHSTHYPLSNCLPITTDRLAQFIAFCHNLSFQANTISTYVSALGYIHKLYNLANPTESFVIKKLLYSLRRTSTADKRLPFTIANIRTLLFFLRSNIKDHYHRVLLKAMFLMAFFGLFRVGELSLSHNGHQNTISRQDLTFLYTDSKLSSAVVTIRNYKHSKGQCTSIPLASQSNKQLCPVRALFKYIRLCPSDTGPLFKFANGEPVTATFFRSNLRTCVVASQLSPHRYTSHSFRIGGATHAHSQNMSASQIQQLGRWKSNAYLKYIRANPLPV